MNESNSTSSVQDGEVAVATLDDNEDLQKEVLSKIRESNQKGKSNRMAEVGNARDQRLYFKDIQQFYWSEDKQDVVFGDDDDENAAYTRTFNIFQGYGKIFQALFMGASAKVRAEADDPFSAQSLRNTSQARTYERVYRKFNDTPTQQLEVSRLMWTDGRIVTRTLQREGREITEFWGVLEARVPTTAKCDIETPLKNCSLVQLEDEYPITQLKQQYPDVRTKINSGAGDSYERNARAAVKRQAGSDTSIDVMSGEDSYGSATKTWSYMRPDFYEEFKEASRVELQTNFPDGLLVIHTGDIYLESSACAMDDVLDVIHALPGDGQSRGSIGQTIMTLQDSANTGQNLIEEIFDHGISTTYYDEKTNIDGLNKQREMPGASRKATGISGQALSSAFFETTPTNPPAELMEYVENIRGPQAQFAAALPPAAFGQEMEDQKTASGYAQAKTQALGQLAIVWKPFTGWFSREMTRAVRMASQGGNEIVTTLSPARRGGKAQPVRLNPGSLTGTSFTNASDENFPETYTERGNKFMNVIQAAGPLGQELWKEPDNLYFAKDIWGLDELVIPGEDVRNNVLEDIAQMENERPNPDPRQMPAQPMPPVGAPSAPPPPQVSSIQIDLDFLDQNDLAMGYAEVKRWINSPAGREAKLAKPSWFQNVSLYGLQYKNAIQGPPPPLPPLPPAVKPLAITANWADLPAAAQAAALAQDHIVLPPSAMPPKAPVGVSANA